ncbi:MAG: DUF1772 domain-containing protein, partial [Bacteroidetes bacterium]|nr:DUF1772 domain-containing protein [Bacteroidota bacterium]
MQTTICKFVALLATGLLSGAFMYGFLNVVPTFYEVPLNVHLIYRVQLMRHNGITMQTLMGLSFITPIWYAVLCKGSRAAKSFAILAACMALATFLITRFGNVPINQVIKTWLPSNHPANWEAVLQRWDTFNFIRTLTAVACFISFI